MKKTQGHKVPSPGTLIRISRCSPTAGPVTLGFTDDRSEETIIPDGTHAVVIGEWTRPWDKGGPVTLISCEYGVGWLFPDEIGLL